MSVSLLLGLVYLISELLLTMTRRSRSRTGTKQDRSTLRVVDGSPAPAGRLCRGYSLFAADTAASTAVQLMHRKPLVIED
jgi:hypothetical protein